jgi:hypothetical protein
MLTLRTAWLLSGALALTAPAYAQHDHEAHSTIQGQPIPAPVPRWVADEPLREGMGRIQRALAELGRYERGQISAAEAQDQAGRSLDAFPYIVAHCKLPPERDEALHGLLAPVLSAAQRLKDHPEDVAEIAAMRDAVAAYPRYFNDPGWSKPARHTD